MGTLTLLHGTLGTIVLCLLIVAEETGVPLPLVPGDVLLVVGGAQIDNGSLNPWVYVPLVAAGAVVGALGGYAWARLAGVKALRKVAAKLHATCHLDRASLALTNAGPRGIVVGRAIPGMRVFTTLLAGALQMNVRTLLTGLIPAVIVWVGIMTTLGVLLGAPVENALAQFNHVALGMMLAAAVATAIYVALRHVSHRSAPSPAPGPSA
jgi:membrane protein DedA with SNARE-associated domain